MSPNSCDIPLLPGHAVPAQLVVAERSQLAPGASFEVGVEQHEDGLQQGGVIVEVRIAR